VETVTVELARPPAAVQLASLAMAALSAAAMLWLMLPEWRQEQIRRRWTAAADGCARRCGSAAMTRELSRGLRDGYLLPYCVSRLRDLLRP
jgi:hypothetical protein